MKTLCALALTVGVVATLTACTPASEPAPTVTVTVTPKPADEWQRFRDDPKEAFIFATSYQMIWGSPIGNGENADTWVQLSYKLCESMRKQSYGSWDDVKEALGADETADKTVLLAQIYCPEVKF